MNKLFWLMLFGFHLFAVALSATVAAPIKDFSDAWFWVLAGVMNGACALFVVEVYFKECEK